MFLSHTKPTTRLPPKTHRNIGLVEATGRREVEDRVGDSASRCFLDCELEVYFDRYFDEFDDFVCSI